MSDKTEATCRCGQVRVAINGAPAITAACHCTGCQAMTASAFSLGVMYHQAAVNIEGDTVLGGLKGESQHHCCANCLSWMYTKARAFGPMITIHSSALAEFDEQPPFMEVCTDEKLSWVNLGAAHSFARFPPPDQFSRLLAEFGASRRT